MLMNYEEALSYINDKDKFGSRPGLDEIGELLRLLGNPEKGLNYIHVAGTNGKGSTVAYLSSILQEEGYRVGVFTSPFLERFNERIAINNKDIEDDRLADITSRIKDVIPKMLENGFEHPTTFEIVTAIAFMYFKEEKVDYVVLEVGLGGLEDSTNIIESPLAAVITTIDFDHIDVLGNTLKEIAYQKAGIIKDDTVVISYPQKEEAAHMIEKISKEKRSPLFICPMDKISIKEMTDRGSRFDFDYEGKTYKDLKVKLLGEYQVYNGVMAAYTILKLRELGRLEIKDTSIIRGLEKTKWRGRLEIISEDPRILIDGAHNLQGAEVLRKSLEMFDYKKLILGFSVLKDKDYDHIIENLIPMADEVILTDIQMPRRMDLDEMKELVAKYKDRVYIEKDNKKAIEKAIELYDDGDLIVFAGSLYLIGNIRTIVTSN